LHKAVDAEQLTLPSGLTPPQLRMLLNRLGRQKWHVQIMERYAHGQGVVTYLARYLRGGPFNPTRVVTWNDQSVTFRYADNQDPDAQGRGRRKLLTLTVAEFLHRWLLHVPPPGLQVVRAYGLYAPTKRETLAQGRQALGQAPVTVPPVLDWQAYCAQRGAHHPECCPVCGQRLIRTATVPSQRPPPQFWAIALCRGTARPVTGTARGRMTLKSGTDLAQRVRSLGRLVAARLPQHSSPCLSVPRTSLLPQQRPAGIGARPLPTRQCLQLQQGRLIQSP